MFCFLITQQLEASFVSAIAHVVPVLSGVECTGVVRQGWMREVGCLWVLKHPYPTTKRTEKRGPEGREGERQREKQTETEKG